MQKVPELVLLAASVAIFSSCSTSNVNSGSHFTYSKTVNRTSPDSPIHVYFDDYWRAVSGVELSDDLQYKQRISTSGLLGEERIGFQTGIIEIDYSISKAGALRIETIRTRTCKERANLSCPKRDAK